MEDQKRSLVDLMLEFELGYPSAEPGDIFVSRENMLFAPIGEKLLQRQESADLDNDTRESLKTVEKGTEFVFDSKEKDEFRMGFCRFVIPSLNNASVIAKIVCLSKVYENINDKDYGKN